MVVAEYDVTITPNHMCYVDKVSRKTMVKVRTRTINRITKMINDEVDGQLDLITISVSNNTHHTLTISRWIDEERTYFTVYQHDLGGK